MAFRIEISTSAELDIVEAIAHISKDSPVLAKKWFLGLYKIINSLKRLPMRHTLIPEALVIKRPIRSILYNSYRIAYEVNSAQRVVHIVRVYHGARRPLLDKDI